MSDIQCPECFSSEHLTWSIHKKSNVLEGKLCTHDVNVFFVLSCEQCSEDIDIVSEDNFMQIVNIEGIRP